uniref:Uncharacterized protein n=1 Tax=Oryctolagus cuniculus TaxID=9986 RepID=G1TUG2_RABIT
MAVPPSTVPGTMANSSALDTYYDLRAKLERSQQNVQDMREKFLTARATVYFLANRLQRHGCEEYKDLIASVLEEKPDFEEICHSILHFCLLPYLRGQDSLVQARARELTHLRRKIQEGREVCSLFAQHLKDTGQAFEGLLRSTDVARHHRQRFCEQLAQGSQLAESLARKLTAGKWLQLQRPFLLQSASQEGEPCPYRPSSFFCSCLWHFIHMCCGLFRALR